MGVCGDGERLGLYMGALCFSFPRLFRGSVLYGVIGGLQNWGGWRKSWAMMCANSSSASRLDTSPSSSPTASCQDGTDSHAANPPHLNRPHSMRRRMLTLVFQAHKLHAAGDHRPPPHHQRRKRLRDLHRPLPPRRLPRRPAASTGLDRHSNSPSPHLFSYTPPIPS